MPSGVGDLLEVQKERIREWIIKYHCVWFSRMRVRQSNAV
jgi:hypothetical protein